MRLRTVVLVLSLLAFLSASTGGYLYYFYLKQSSLAEAGKDSASRAQAIKDRLVSFLHEQQRPVRALAGLQEMQKALSDPNEHTVPDANRILDHFNDALGTNVCYLMNVSGETIASSNRLAPDSFVGKNFAFRPYFRRAIKGFPATRMALGTASGRRGVYYSYPVYKSGYSNPIGVAVIKAPIEPLEKELHQGQGEIVLLTDPHGIVFISNRKDWLLHSLWKLSSEEEREIAASRQFGEGPFPWTGLKMESPDRVVDPAGNRYLDYQMPIESFPRWSVVYLQNLDAIAKKLSDPLLSITGATVLALCVLVLLSVAFLYRKASYDIVQRKTAEEALRESEERYRSLYHRTPGMLHSVDPDGRLLSVSDYWVEALGYAPSEVIGRKLSDFLTEGSRKFAEEVVLPQFLEKGYCKGIPYRFVKKSGEIVDVLLSAIAERDAQGNIKRSLSLLVDVTEQKRAQEQLRVAKEQLRSYSEDLERQVAQRTGEITGILKNTPSVVYLKDTEYRYILVNSRFEQLFGLREEEVQGKTDHDLFPPDVADRIRANDRQVFAEGRAHHIEESLPSEDGPRTYLTVKFPLTDDRGYMRSICGIATDITVIIKAQDQMRRLSGRIMAGQEKERTAIARELHDELGQVLTALKMDSVWLRERLKQSDPDAAERAAEACELIDETIGNVRSIALRLRPGVLDDLGLIPALEWHIGDFEKRTRISCNFEHADVPEVGNVVATAAYRIAQEALTNVARHSRASRVFVSLRVEAGNLILAVADEGLGFDPSFMADAEGLGIAGMRERAALVGGSMEIQSQPGRGTVVTFRVALHQDGE